MASKITTRSTKKTLYDIENILDIFKDEETKSTANYLKCMYYPYSESLDSN